jgi:hypothetical protein
MACHHAADESHSLKLKGIVSDQCRMARQAHMTNSHATQRYPTLRRPYLLSVLMKKYFMLLAATVFFGGPAVGAMAGETDCGGCDSPGQASLQREQIKADRAKYDRENELEGSRREQIRAARAKYDRENEAVTARLRDVIKAEQPLPAAVAAPAATVGAQPAMQTNSFESRFSVVK